MLSATPTAVTAVLNAYPPMGWLQYLIKREPRDAVKDLCTRSLAPQSDPPLNIKTINII
jgi:hypothetical protein